VRRRPYSVVLFDEIEKAHPDVFHTLLQLLDDGRLTDAQGRTVSFKNTVVLLTSNVGSTYLLEGITPQGELAESVRDRVMEELRRHFRPEFLNRIDDVVLFKPLVPSEIEKIVELLLTDVRKRLDENRIRLEVTDEARAFIAREGYDAVYGARPLHRFLRRHVETPLARLVLERSVATGATVTVSLGDGELRFDVGEAPGANGEAPEAVAAVG